jgi:alpha-D-xyloside xylohydrolase
MTWNDSTRTLTIGARSGSYPGMPASRTFTVVLVSPQSAIGYGATANNPVTYTGSAITVRLR